MHAQPQPRVLVAETDQRPNHGHSEALEASGAKVVKAASSEEAIAELCRCSFDVVVVSTSLRGELAWGEFVDTIFNNAARPQVVLIENGNGDAEEALRAEPVFARFRPPIDPDQIVQTVQEAARSRIRSSSQVEDPLMLFTQSSVPAVRRAVSLCELAQADRTIGVLILGEPGVGKRSIAQLVHDSPDVPILTIDLLAGLPTTLEDLVFSALKTMSDPDASRATIILNEISALRPEDQLFLLQIVDKQDGLVTNDNQSTLRIVATSAQPIALLADGRKLDSRLFTYLANVLVPVPPIRERPADIHQLADYFLSIASKEIDRDVPMWTPSALQVLKEHSWPGNLAEMRRIMSILAASAVGSMIDRVDVERAFAIPRVHPDRSITPAPMGRRVRTTSLPPKISGVIAAALDDDARAERERIEASLDATGGHRGRAAAILGMSRTTLWTRMRMLGIDYNRFKKRSTG